MKIVKLSIGLLKEFTPERIKDSLLNIHPKMNLYSIIGWFGGTAVNTNALQIPPMDALPAIIGYKRSKQKKISQQTHTLLRKWGCSKIQPK